MARLGDYVIVQEKSKIKAGDGLSKGKYKFFTSSNIQSKWVNEFQYNQPALIFGTGGMPSVHYCVTPFSTSTDCIVMFAKENSNIEIIYYYLQGNMYLLGKGFRGVGLQHISKKFILDIKIPQIPKEKQQHITATLGKVSELIRLRKEQLAKLDEAVKARFVEMFGELFYSDVKHYTVPEIAYVYIGLVTTMTKHYVDKGTPLIFNSTIKDNRFEFKEKIYLDDEFAMANDHRKHRTNDIITVHTGDVGTSAIIGPELEGSLGFATIVSRINDMDFVRPAYLCDFFNSQLCKNQLTLMTRGDRNNLNLKEFNQIRLTIPPIEQQFEWELFRKQTDKSKLAVQQSLDELETLKKALMQEYFG